jgi:hypothetical protein
MLVLRLLGALLIVVVGAAAVVYIVTKDRRWLRFARQSLVFGVVILLIFLALYALERLLLIL